MLFCGFMMVVLLFKAISMIVVNPFVYFRSTPPGGTNDFLSSIFCCNSAGDFALCIGFKGAYLFHLDTDSVSKN